MSVFNNSISPSSRTSDYDIGQYDLRISIVHLHMTVAVGPRPQSPFPYSLPYPAMRPFPARPHSSALSSTGTAPRKGPNVRDMLSPDEQDGDVLDALACRGLGPKA